MFSTQVCLGTPYWIGSRAVASYLSNNELDTGCDVTMVRDVTGLVSDEADGHCLIVCVNGWRMHNVLNDRNILISEMIKLTFLTQPLITFVHPLVGEREESRLMSA